MKHAGPSVRRRASIPRGLAPMMICAVLGATPARAGEGAPANPAGVPVETRPIALPMLLMVMVVVTLGGAGGQPKQEPFY